MLTAPSVEIDSCDYLFLREITELEKGELRLAVFEGRAIAESVVSNIGGTQITDLHPVRPTGKLFEIIWKTYITYSVRNESYFAVSKDEEIVVGKKFRIYSNSNFLDFVSRGTFATTEYPGPFQHYGVLCENHIIDVVSIDAPQIQRL
jgi:hypothetical protein